MIDEAFMPLSRMIAEMLSFQGDFVDDEAGVRMHITACELELPVELSIGRDAQGGLQIGSTPPLYHVDTTIRPSFHQVRLVAVRGEPSDATEDSDGG